MESTIDVPEQLFEAVYTQVFSPKTGVVTKDGLEMRASNLVLVLLAFAREPIENYLRTIHACFSTDATDSTERNPKRQLYSWLSRTSYSMVL